MVTERGGKGLEFERKQKPGSIEVICGPMFCGKTDEFIRRLRRAEPARLKTVVFKPKIDDRRDKDTVNTADGTTFPATPVNSSEEIFQIVSGDKGIDIVAIDEAQFFDEGLIDVCRKLALQGKKVIVAGLDTDFRGEVFGFMGELMVEADEIEKLTAICMKCGSELASRTQRMKIVDGERVPAHYSDDVIKIGEEEYEARCRHCHEVPGRPE